MIARAGAWCSVNFDRFSLKSKTMAMEMIRAMEKEIVAQKLLDNVPVELLDVPERVEKPEYAQEPELVEPASAQPDEPPELAGSPSAGAVEPAVFSIFLKSFMMLAYLNSSAKLVDDGILPCHEIALLDMMAGIGHEAQIEREVVDAGYLHRQQLLEP